MLYGETGEVPMANTHSVRRGRTSRARARRSRSCVRAHGAVREQGSRQAREEGISVEVIDPHDLTARPRRDPRVGAQDRPARRRRRGRPVLRPVSEIAGLAACEGFAALKAPVQKVTPRTHPCRRHRPRAVVDSVPRQIEQAVRATLQWQGSRGRAERQSRATKEAGMGKTVKLAAYMRCAPSRRSGRNSCGSSATEDQRAPARARHAAVRGAAGNDDNEFVIYECFTDTAAQKSTMDAPYHRRHGGGGLSVSRRHTSHRVHLRPAV